jgi:DNA-binding IclR family transcriptional regulator
MHLTSLKKSLRIIDFLYKYPKGLSLNDLSKMLGQPKSSIHHVLSTFVLHQYVVQDPETRKYSLGYKFLSIGKMILDNIDIRKKASPYLRELHEKCKTTVHLAVLQNGQLIYIDKVEQPGNFSLATYIGFSTDPHAAAGGKVLLSELPPAKVKEMYRNKELKKYGKKTITNLGELFEELQRVKKQGYAIDDEEYYKGIRCVAAPIRAGGQIIAALSITGPAFQLTKERIRRELKDLIVQTAKRISEEAKW